MRLTSRCRRAEPLKGARGSLKGPCGGECAKRGAPTAVAPMLEGQQAGPV